MIDQEDLAQLKKLTDIKLFYILGKHKPINPLTL